MLAFAALRRRMPYEEAIRWTLGKQGDTDTNAAIVGAMIGALHGASHIPEAMREPVMRFDPVRCPEGGAGASRDLRPQRPSGPHPSIDDVEPGRGLGPADVCSLPGTRAFSL